MERTPEPELMDEPTQVEAYAAADFAAPDQRFVEAFTQLYHVDFQGEVIDLGCGPGNIALRLAAALPAVQVLGVDGAPRMVEAARRLAADHASAERVDFAVACLPAPELPAGRFAGVVSNSLLHHLHTPEVLWQTIRRVGAPGAAVLVGDLRRPASREAAQALVDAYADGAPEVLRADFLASLLAAFEVDEVRAQLAATGLGHLTVEAVGDRHLLVHGRLDNAPAP